MIGLFSYFSGLRDTKRATLEMPQNSGCKKFSNVTKSHPARRIQICCLNWHYFIERFLRSNSLQFLRFYAQILKGY